MKSITRYFYTLTSLTFLLIASASLSATENAKKVLMVVSGYGQEQGKVSPGYEFDELSKAYLVFKANSVDVDIASPQGGAVEADQYDTDSPYNAQVLSDAAIMAKLNNTLSVSTLDASHYDGIFIVGGKGAMFDLPKDLSLQQLIADIYQQQGSVAAVCHGPAALVDVKLADGSYLVANKAVNGFTNDEESLFGKKWLPKFEFMLQDKLTERGGKFQSSEIMLNHVAVDGRLITGQNPSSTVAVAHALVNSLGIEPVPITPFRDDKTLALVAELLAGNDEVINTLLSDPEQYHLDLVGMYGYYYLNIAKSDKEFQNALSLMIAAQKSINNPTLDMQIAKTQYKLGDKLASKKTLDQILASTPDYEPAQEMLKTLAL